MPAARMRPGEAPPRKRGSLRVATRNGASEAVGLMGLTGPIRLTHHQVTRRRPAK